MKNIKRTLLFVGLLLIVRPAKAWLGSITPAITSRASGIISYIGSTASKLLPTVGTVGAAAASTVVPFGLGPIAMVAAPYLVAAGANYITKKVSGIDIAKEKYREELQSQVAELTGMMKSKDKKYNKLMRKIKKLRKLRRRRKIKHLEEDDDIDEIND
jgi:hypothetical protein